MAENSNISWTDHTFNPWTGCTKISAGCAACYAAELSERFGRGEYKRGVPRKRTSAANWKQPLKWNKTVICEYCGQANSHSERCPIHVEGTVLKLRRPRVFFSLADPFDDEVPIEWLADFLKLIHDTPNLDWLLLTKRPENWTARMVSVRDDLNLHLEAREFALRWIEHGKEGIPHNVWLGVTAENQEMADKRIPELLKIPATVRFLSCEPLLSKIDLERSTVAVPSGEHCPHCKEEITMNIFGGYCECSCCVEGPEPCLTPKIDWVIAGGESGPKRREMKLEWMTSLWQQCAGAGIPFFCKQDSALRPGQQGRIPHEIWNTKEFPKKL